MLGAALAAEGRSDHQRAPREGALGRDQLELGAVSREGAQCDQRLEARHAPARDDDPDRPVRVRHQAH